MKFTLASAAAILSLTPLASACMKVTVKYITSTSTVLEANLWDNGVHICQTPNNLPITTRQDQELECFTIDGLPWSAVLKDPNTTEPYIVVKRGDFEEKIWLYWEVRSGFAGKGREFTAAVWDCSKKDLEHTRTWLVGKRGIEWSG